MRWPLDQASREVARAWWAMPEPRPVTTPRVAATVALVREGPTGIEVFVLRRDAGMRFAPGMIVFPGGGLDPSDADVEQAAVRELFEETGVLLATDPDGRFPDTSTAEWEARRLAVESRARGLAEVLGHAALTPRTDVLLPWSRWVTPEYLPIRYDTWFFVACAPDGQRARQVAGEAVDAFWARPVELLEDSADLLMPPTLGTLMELAEAGSWPEVVARVMSVGGDLRGPSSLEPRITQLIVDGEFYLEHPPPLSDWPPPDGSARFGADDAGGGR